MSHFGGHPEDIIVDPSDRGPVEDAHIFIYDADPRVGAAQMITGLTDINGLALPGYVPSDIRGRIEFLTVDPYDTVWGVDPENRTYRYDSWEIADLSAAAANAYPQMSADVAQAKSDSATAITLATSAAQASVPSSEASRLTGEVNGTTSVDARTALPKQKVQLHLSANNVIQAAVRLRETGEWYVSQAAAGTVAGRETTIIDRLRADGTLLDTMTLPDAGHGVYISVEQIDGEAWVWIRYMRYSGSTAVSGNVVRIKWLPGTFDPTTAGANMQTIFTAGPSESFQAVLDSVARQVCIFISGRYRLYGLDDCLANGRNAKQIGVEVAPNLTGSTGQGVAIAGSTLYRYTGEDSTNNASAEHKLLGVYSFNTGANLYLRDLNALLPVGEPEGAFIYFDDAGLPALELGVSTGPGGSRTSYVYEITSPLRDLLDTTVAPRVLTGSVSDLTVDPAFTVDYLYMYAIGRIAYVMMVFTTINDIPVPSTGSGDLTNMVVATIKSSSPFYNVVVGPSGGTWTSGTFGLVTSATGVMVSSYLRGGDRAILLSATAVNTLTKLNAGWSFSATGTFLLAG